MSRQRVVAFASVAIAAGWLVACANRGEPYSRPEVAVPKAWFGQAGPTAEPRPAARWWTTFGSAELDALVAEAQANNHPLKAAAARVEQARAAAEAAGAALYPAVSVDAAGSRTKFSGSAASDNFSVGLGAAWELDLWGTNRYALASAEAALQASRHAEEAARLNLVADVATTYFQVLVLNDNLKAAQDSLANARRVLDRVEAQKQAGRGSALQLEQQRGAVAGAEAAIPPLVQQRLAILDSLALLLGRVPGKIELADRSLISLKLPAVAPLAPRELLEQRPDIRQAEAALVAAHADVGAARAALLPRLQLSASAATTAERVGRLFDAGTGFTSLGLDALATIFDGGRLASRVTGSQARQRELIETYRQTVLSAWRDVEEALAGIELLAAQEDRQRAVQRHAGNAYRLAELRYRAGATDFLSLLDAQRAVINAEVALSNTRFLRLATLVALYRAQGGGREEAGSSFPTSPPTGGATAAP